MAQGRRQGIRRVVGLGYGLKVQQELDHVLDLGLVRVAVGGDRKLDLHGRVLVEGQSLLLGGQNGHASARAYGDGGGDVVVEEQLLKHRTIRPVHLYKLGHPVIEPLQPLREGNARLGLHYPVIHGGGRAPVSIYDAIAQQRVSWVDP